MAKRDIIKQVGCDDRKILDKGEMQVSEKERDSLLLNLRKELVSLVTSRIVHPDTNRMFPVQTIEEAIGDIGFDVKINDSAKKQANFLIKELASRYFIKKADMEIKVSIREEWVNTGVDAGEDIEIQPIKKMGVDAQDVDEEPEEQGMEDAEEKPKKKDPIASGKDKKTVPVAKKEKKGKENLKGQEEGAEQSSKKVPEADNKQNKGAGNEAA